MAEKPCLMTLLVTALIHFYFYNQDFTHDNSRIFQAIQGGPKIVGLIQIRIISISY